MDYTSTRGISRMRGWWWQVCRRLVLRSLESRFLMMGRRRTIRRGKLFLGTALDSRISSFVRVGMGRVLVFRRRRRLIIRSTMAPPTTKSSKDKPQKNSTAPKPAKTKKPNSAAPSTKSPKKSNSSRCLENKKEPIMGRNAPTVARKPKKQMMSSAPQLSRITMRRRTCLSSLMWIISGVRSRSRDTSLCNTQHSN